MYANSPQQDVFQNLPLPENHGWKFSEDGRYTIDWESPEVQDRVKGTIEFLTKGCTCKQGCHTRQCDCKKQSKLCGPGCECCGCVNLPVNVSNNTDFNSDSDTDSEGVYNEKKRAKQRNCHRYR